jgi:hypothetical protein
VSYLRGLSLSLSLSLCLSLHALALHASRLASPHHLFRPARQRYCSCVSVTMSLPPLADDAVQQQMFRTSSGFGVGFNGSNPSTPVRRHTEFVDRDSRQVCAQPSLVRDVTPSGYCLRRRQPPALDVRACRVRE